MNIYIFEMLSLFQFLKRGWRAKMMTTREKNMMTMIYKNDIALHFRHFTLALPYFFK